MDTSNFFDHYFKNAKLNCLLVLDIEGNILEVSHSFTTNFGYTNEDLKGKNFKILYTETDIKNDMPGKEVNNILKRGQSNDENFVVHKNGSAIWCTGESILVKVENNE